ncbi:thioesterase thiol ester dehydrase-isomerase [Mycena belliarum]|uniref:Thioesterase thiol ester dehydrase-isomerase n=1 Tax=Mycena belliarum TaxID=1033014 RepID=A0AAD6UDF2_9AGAR|nr:thioesterase thiol ester dehydrase-isomerase [Mycena belliae]
MSAANTNDSHPTADSQSSSKVDTATASAGSGADVFNHVQTQLTTYLTSSPLYQLLLSDIVLSSASSGNVSLKLVVLPLHVNSKSVLHGSLSATLVDLVAGLAIVSTGSPKTGVSTDMHVSFVSSAREGDTLWVEGIAERVGGTLAFTRVRVEKEGAKQGARTLVATGTHTKYVK